MNSLKSTSQVITPGEVRLLTEIGFLACGAGNIDAAHRIFDGLRCTCRDSPSALIGLAMSQIESGAPDIATSLLRQHYNNIEPDNYDYKIFFALSLLASGLRSEADRVLQDLLQMSNADCPAHRLGRALINNYLRDSRIIHTPVQTTNTAASQHIA